MFFFFNNRHFGNRHFGTVDVMGIHILGIDILAPTREINNNFAIQKRVGKWFLCITHIFEKYCNNS